MSSTSPSSFASVYASQIADKATAALDVRDGKRRWLFYFEGGALIGTRSNLKSEKLASIKAQKPDLSDTKLHLLQAIRRVKNAVQTGVVPKVADGAEPKERVPSSAGLVLVKGLVSARSEDEMTEMAGDLLGQTAALSGDLSDAGASARLARHLGGGDARSGADRIDGAPGRRSEALAVLWLAHQLNILTVQDDAPATAPAAALGGVDFSDLINDTMGNSPDANPDPAPASSASGPAPAPFSPFGGGGAAVEIDDGDDDDDDDDDDQPGAPPASVSGHPSPLGIDKAAPTPEQAIHVEAVSADTKVETRTSGFNFPSFQAAPEPPSSAAPAPPPAPKKHPMEDQLRDLHARLMVAENHFDVLEVKWDAEVEAFRKAHLELARVLHPDRYADATIELQSLANEAFDKVRAAWEVLNQTDQRTAYIDSVIHGIKTEDEKAMEAVEAYWSAEADFKRGLALFNNGRISNAHDYFAAAVGKVPDELEFKAYWAFTSFQKVKAEDPEKAEEFKEILKDVLDKNQQQDRKLDAGWVLMGKIYRDLINDSAAKKCFVIALKLNPSNGDANRELRRLSGGAPGATKKKDGKKKEDKKKGGFFGRMFGGKGGKK